MSTRNYWGEVIWGKFYQNFNFNNSGLSHFGKFQGDYKGIPGRESFGSPKVRKRENKVIYNTSGTGVMRSPRGILKSLGLGRPAKNLPHEFKKQKSEVNRFRPVSEISETDSIGISL